MPPTLQTQFRFVTYPAARTSIRNPRLHTVCGALRINQKTDKYFTYEIKGINTTQYIDRSALYI